MTTHKQIQQYVKGVYGYTPKTCWIAHMKEVCDLIQEFLLTVIPLIVVKILAHSISKLIYCIEDAVKINCNGPY